MKNYKTISFLFLLIIFYGCSATSTFEEANYTMPEVKYQPRITYPAEAEGKNYAGISEVYIHISETGIVEKATLLESSGYDVLDQAALAYCKQIVFKPAMSNGKPVECNTVQKVNFNLFNKEFSFKEYVSNIKTLYRLEKSASGKEADQIRDRILENHIEFVHKMSNVVSFNSVLEKIMQPEIYAEWERSSEYYPLTFLLYHDFIQRCPGYSNLDVAKEELRKALESDLHFIKITKTGGAAEEENRMGLVVKIKRFMEKYYPEVHIDEYPVAAGVSS